MTGRPIGGLAPQTHSFADAAHGDSTPLRVVTSSEALSGSPSTELQAELRNLQRLVCELLFKNQQLRMALMEATSESVNIVAHME